jgi:hypothetical protein
VKVKIQGHYRKARIVAGRKAADAALVENLVGIPHRRIRKSFIRKVLHRLMRSLRLRG